METKQICEFCLQKFKKEDLIDTKIDEGEVASLCENCKTELENDTEW